MIKRTLFISNPFHVSTKLNQLVLKNKKTGEEMLPTFWDDNYITLLPGEEKEIEAKFSSKDIKDGSFKVIINNNM